MRTLIRKLKNILFFSSILLFFAFNFQGNPPQGWYLQTLPVNKTINDIYFADSLNGWAGTTGSSAPGDTAYILKTTNGGDNWTVSFKRDSMVFHKIQFLNVNTGYAAGGSGNTTLYKTTNAGNNWIKLLGTFAVGGPIIGMQFINLDTGWYCDNNFIDGGVFKTTNGGVNWVRQLDQNFSIAALDFPSKDTGYAVNNQKLYKTTNGGNNWNLQYDFQLFLREEVKFLNSQTGWVAGANYLRVFKTTNGGFNWITQYPISNNDSISLSTIRSLNIINKDTLWAIGGKIKYSPTRARGFIIMSTNGGDKWGYQVPDTSLGIEGYGTLFFSGKKHGWAYVINNKGVHTKIGGNDSTYYITGINSPVSEVPRSFILYQNYPNPFNPSTTINYELKNTNYVTLKVFDLQGREIQTLVNKKQSAGNYEVQFNGTNLSSGIYFYTIEINSGNEVYKDTKKMILLK